MKAFNSGFLTGLAVGVALTGLAVVVARRRIVELLTPDAEEIARLRKASTRLRARLESEADCKCFGLLIPDGSQWRYVNNVTNSDLIVKDNAIALQRSKQGVLAVIAKEGAGQ